MQAQGKSRKSAHPGDHSASGPIDGGAGVPGYWALQDAKARLSELVRKVRSEGPQHVTVHGRDEVVVISAEEFRRLQGRRTGRDLITAMQSSPCRELDLIAPGSAMPVRPVDL